MHNGFGSPSVVRDYIGKIRRHEEKGRKYLEMMLFGIVEGEE